MTMSSDDDDDDDDDDEFGLTMTMSGAQEPGSR